MKKQTIIVNVQHNVNLQPLASATVSWSEHYANPDEKHHSMSEQSKQFAAVTDKKGIALIATDIEESVPDGFNIPFKYYNKIWISIDSIECKGFKTCEVNKVFPAIGEEYGGIKSADKFEHTVYMVPES